MGDLAEEIHGKNTLIEENKKKCPGYEGIARVTETISTTVLECADLLLRRSS